MNGTKYSRNAEQRRESHASPVREPKSFGKRREPATITITSAGKARHFTVRPVFLTLTVSLAAMFLIGYLGATAYLVSRDNLIGAARTHNAKLIREYEDRIAALRTNLDRVTSRQLLDQQTIETRIAELMRRQEVLQDRSSRIGALIGKAEKSGLTADIRKKAEIRNREGKDRAAALRSTDPVTTGSPAPGKPSTLALAGGISLRGSHDMIAGPATTQVAANAPNDALFSSLIAGIDDIDLGQRAVLDDIRMAALKRTAKIANVLDRLKVALPEGGHDAPEQIGGPFIPAPESPFETNIRALGSSLDSLERMTSQLGAVPLVNPAPSHPVTSTFGVRVDPFLGRAAMHSGVDFGVMTGTPVKATADGTVIDAGRNGGSGNMVEVDHGNGLSTRYAHLSRINVVSGQKVERGTVIGLSGSTGRSTGPHLHYEVRRKGDAVNPARFLKAGRELSGIL